MNIGLKTRSPLGHLLRHHDKQIQLTYGRMGMKGHGEITLKMCTSTLCNKTQRQRVGVDMPMRGGTRLALFYALHVKYQYEVRRWKYYSIRNEFFSWLSNALKISEKAMFSYLLMPQFFI